MTGGFRSRLPAGLGDGGKGVRLTCFRTLGGPESSQPHRFPSPRRFASPPPASQERQGARGAQGGENGLDGRFWQGESAEKMKGGDGGGHGVRSSRGGGGHGARKSGEEL
jgi:hypothetical protein